MYLRSDIKRKFRCSVLKQVQNVNLPTAINSNFAVLVFLCESSAIITWKNEDESPARANHFNHEVISMVDAKGIPVHCSLSITTTCRSDSLQPTALSFLPVSKPGDRIDP